MSIYTPLGYTVAFISIPIANENANSEARACWCTHQLHARKTALYLLRAASNPAGYMAALLSASHPAVRIFIGEWYRYRRHKWTSLQQRTIIRDANAQRPMSQAQAAPADRYPRLA